MTRNYDGAGNRTSQQTGNALGRRTYNGLNQLLSQQGGGNFPLRGKIDEPGNVTVNGQPAAIKADGSFSATLQAAPGANTVAVDAVDRSGNAVHQAYQVTTTAALPNRSFTYDPNGNLTSDGDRTYEWDAFDRLTAINYVGTNQRSEFTYDGMWRRVRIVEKSGADVTSDKRFLCERGGTQPIEERDGSNAVTRRFYPQGEQIAGSNNFITRDHLGSVRELIDSTGVLRAQYSYTLAGSRSKMAGFGESSFGFTGHYFHQTSDLHLTTYRAYDAGSARWLSRDPLEEEAGLNLYGYVFNRPVSEVDPDGRQAAEGALGGAEVGSAILPGIGTAIGAVVGAGIGIGIGYCIARSIQKRKCKPCVPPVGTIAYRVDMPPSPAHNGIPTPHSHRYIMIQRPYPSCICQWSKMDKDPFPGVHGPEMNPAQGGGK